MSEQKCEAKETPVCCCVDVGTIIDNENCGVEFEQVYLSQEEAEVALQYLTEKANKAANDGPCQIASSIEKKDHGFLLSAEFVFSCQAESMIFQLSTR